MTTRIEIYRPAAAEVGEGPVWDAATETLVWVDIHAGQVYRERADGTRETIDVGQHVGAALPSEEPGALLLLLRDGFYARDTDGELTPLARPLADEPGIRFNDGKVDPAGRAFGGTMPYSAGHGVGALYRLDPAGLTTCVEPVGLANGLGWSPDARWMYFVDSGANTVFRYSYDLASGELSAPTPFVEVDPARGMPDGLTVDDSGCVWVALWGGAALHRYSPAGDLDRVVRLPVSQPTSMAFAGPGLTTLVVSTAHYNLSPAALEAEPWAGSLLALDAGCSGPAATPWKPLKEFPCS